MAATVIQYGLTNKRINREPIDAETVLSSYVLLQSYTGINPSQGQVYDGFITSVLSLDNTYTGESHQEIPTYKVPAAGPWYIRTSYSGNNASYTGDRILTNYETKSYVGHVKTAIETEIEEVVFSWGHLT